MDALVEGSANLDVLIQTAHNPVVQLLGAGRAKATSTIHEIARGVVAIGSSFGDAGTAINFDRYGMYYDEFAKLDGEWKFTHRVFMPFFTTSGVVGDATGSRPLPRPK